MELNEITIKNFRSIRELHLFTEPTCQIFAGEIEAGKSNILKAISYLDKNKLPKKKEQREPIDEENIDSAFIDFDFIFTEDEKNIICKELLNKMYITNKGNKIATIKGKKVDIIEILKYIKGCYRVDFIKETKYAFPFLNLDEIKFEENLRIISEDLEIKNENNELVDLSGYKIIDISTLNDEKLKGLENVKQADLEDFLEDFVSNLVIKNLPNTVLWEYKESNLLPHEVNLEEFENRPSICLPLKSMFELQGITDIRKAIEDAKLRNRNSLINLLDRVAKNASTHFRKVWPNYKNVNFSLELGGENIIITIKDTYNRYDLSDRSDGFKRFVTFLLLVSAKNKSNKLKDSIIIIDEPEISLHIKGQRYLRDELLKISQNNIVFYSTHSIFMVDKNNISRHYIVSKEKEITNIKKVDSSNFTDEEVIFNALGYSIFETLREFNIIFEGWTDKKLFEIAINKIPSQYSKEISIFKDYGTCYSDGVKDIKSTSNILDLIPRPYSILSDSDKIARDKQIEFNKTKPNSWKRYDEIFQERRIITSEDFIKVDILKKELDKVLKEKGQECDITIQDILNAPNGRIKLIENKLRAKRIENNIVKSILHDLKEGVFNNLKVTHIEEDYYEFLNKFKAFIESTYLDRS